MLTIPSTTESIGLPEDLAITYPFPLDPFQQQAIHAIHRGDNVLVTAKTGSGKTLVGEYQIAYSLRLGKRVFYTTPIKSLSNQKYYDLKHLFPKASVGILTGDIKSNPEADIVVMTTEILRNLLFKQATSTKHLGTAGQVSLHNVGAVVFDEVHYINDPDRGHVWEETLILLESHIRLILLSATIDAPDVFAGWLGKAKQHPIVLLKTSHRVVPLIHGVYDPTQKELPMRVWKNGDEAPFQAQVYTDWWKGKDARAKAADDWAKKVQLANANGEKATGEKVKLHSFHHSLNECVSQFKERELLPALFFVFSRKDCERYAELIQGSLLDSSDTATAKHIVHFHLHRYNPTLQNLPQYHQIVRLLERGIAFHHSGLLPLLKEIVELLFSRGYIKVLFCTETFAVGLNMPARTVMFLDLKKPAEGGDFRPLRPDEYIQIAGRAGRRGKDTRGIVMYLPCRNPVQPDELRSSLTGPLSPLISRLQFHYDFVLKALHSKQTQTSTPIWTSVIDASYWQAQRSIALASVQQELDALQAFPSGLSEQEQTEMDVKTSLEAKVKETTNATKRKAQVELERWKERHRGPTWTNVQRLYAEHASRQLSIARLQNQIAILERDVGDARIQPVLRALSEWKALDKDTMELTEFGVFATEINEGNPLLIAKLYESGLLKNCTANEVVAVLGCFIVDRESEEKTVHPNSLRMSEAVKQALLQIDQWGVQGVAIDRTHGVHSPDGFWSLTTLWVEIGSQWMDGVEAGFLSKTYDIYEGNLMRGLLKLANIVNEWITLATYKADVEMLHTFKDVPQVLLRDIAQPESLYLRL